jgi:hypothetical protein
MNTEHADIDLGDPRWRRLFVRVALGYELEQLPDSVLLNRVGLRLPIIDRAEEIIGDPRQAIASKTLSITVLQALHKAVCEEIMRWPEGEA